MAQLREGTYGQGAEVVERSREGRGRDRPSCVADLGRSAPGEVTFFSASRINPRGRGVAAAHVVSHPVFLAVGNPRTAERYRRGGLGCLVSVVIS